LRITALYNPCSQAHSAGITLDCCWCWIQGINDEYFKKYPMLGIRIGKHCRHL